MAIIMLVFWSPCQTVLVKTIPVTTARVARFQPEGGAASQQELTDEVFMPSRKGSLQSAMVAAGHFVIVLYNLVCPGFLPAIF